MPVETQMAVVFTTSLLLVVATTATAAESMHRLSAVITADY